MRPSELLCIALACACLVAACGLSCYGSGPEAREVVISGPMPGGAAEVTLAFDFYDSTTGELAHRVVQRVTSIDGFYVVRIPAGPLQSGRPYMASVTPLSDGNLRTRGGGGSPEPAYVAYKTVQLQDTTPGRQQIGHFNISGTGIAGFFKGDGSQLTNVNADTLDGLDSSAFPQLGADQTWTGVNTFWNTGNTFVGSGAGLTALNGSNISSGTLADARLTSNVALLNNVQTFTGAKTFSGGLTTNAFRLSTGGGAGLVLTSDASGTGAWQAAPGFSLPYSGSVNYVGAAFTVTNTAPSGVDYGAWFQTNSASGCGVYGLATATTGGACGGRFLSTSTSGSGVIGVASAASGTTYGVHGESAGTSGRGVYGLATSASGNNFGGWFESDSTTGMGAVGYADADTGANYGLMGQSDSTTGTGVWGLAAAGSGVTYGGRFETWSPDGIGVYGIATIVGNGSSCGVKGQSGEDKGIGVYGLATRTSGNNFGVKGETASLGGIGVYGLATSTQEFAAGGKFESAAPNGYGVIGVAASQSDGHSYGGYFENKSTNGTAVHGIAEGYSGETYGGDFISYSTSGTAVSGLATADSGRTYAGRFENESSGGCAVYARLSHVNSGTCAQFDAEGSNGTGVYGYAKATDATNIGVLGVTESGHSGRGVEGHAKATTGYCFGGYFESESTSGYGVFGFADANTGTTYGACGQADSSNGYGIYAWGRLGASGTKSFRIDHPFDPENMYLLHYCHEGPEPQNVYNGNVITDAQGYATITLPDYFEEINKDPRYTLTVVDDGERQDFVLVKVVRKIRNNQFTIRTSAPFVEVSWEVKAVRNDLWVRKYGAPVEVQKGELERGKYQHPELYGLDPDMGVDCHRGFPAEGHGQ
jgi:hypothetical protein